VTVKAVQRQLGHKSATLTVDRYGHLFPDELDALATALEGLKSADNVRTIAGRGSAA
jgi:integrase